MNCSDYEPLINAWIDGELPPDGAVKLQSHLAACPECAAVAEFVRAENAQLQLMFSARHAELLEASTAVELASRALAAESGSETPRHSTATAQPERAPDNVIAGSQPAFSQQLPAQRPAGVSRSSLVSWICATAAALLILAFSWNPPEKLAGDGGVVANIPAAIAEARSARLVVATGPVFVGGKSEKDLIACLPADTLPPGWKVVTGESARCELATAPNLPVRLDQNTELQDLGSNKMRLEKGRMWTATEGEFCQVESPVANVSTSNATFEFSCASDTGQAVLNVLSGSVDVTAPGSSGVAVNAGETLTIQSGGKSVQSLQQFQDPVLQTRWFNPILVAKGYENPELVERVQWLWSQVASKDPTRAAAYESEIRGLGGCTVGPLCNWVQSPASYAEPTKRAEAARLLSDLAGPDAVPRLIELLSDQDGDVRYFAAVALQRLTGQTRGHSPEEWRALPPAPRQKARSDWSNWWNIHNKDG